jgi:hypothetical protein
VLHFHYAEPTIGQITRTLSARGLLRRSSLTISNETKMMINPAAVASAQIDLMA